MFVFFFFFVKQTIKLSNKFKSLNIYGRKTKKTKIERVSIDNVASQQWCTNKIC